MPGLTAPILEKALDGERITDDEALTLLESKDLVAVGKAADELRARRTDAGRITFIKCSITSRARAASQIGAAWPRGLARSASISRRSGRSSCSSVRREMSRPIAR